LGHKTPQKIELIFQSRTGRTKAVESVRERNDIIEKIDYSMIFLNINLTELHIFEKNQELKTGTTPQKSG
jgi:hypothetical protein